MREVRRVGSSSVVLYCAKDVEQALFANTPISAGEAFRNLGAVACPARVACGGESRTLGNTGYADTAKSLRQNKDNFAKIAARVARPVAGPIPGFGGDWCDSVGVCPGARHDIPQFNSQWTAAYLHASLRHDFK